jgi:Ion channel
MRLIREELGRLTTVGEHHRRLAARVLLVTSATLAVAAIGTVAIYLAERHAHGSQIHTIGQAAFFTVTQLLTVSSSMHNPLTPAGRCVDVVLEAWGVLVVAGSAGAVASFYRSIDRP